MSNILPIFTTHYSLGSSLLTLEESGKTEPGNPVSICDIAKDNNLSQVIIVDERIDGFLEAYKNLSKPNKQLIYGIKLCVCEDMNQKDDDSLRTESNVVIFIKNSQGYNDLIRLWNRAWIDGFYYKGRLDWKTLKEFWTENLLLALPFFSSFLAKNLLTFSSIVPTFPINSQEIYIHKEIDSGLPFAPLIEKAIDTYVSQKGGIIQECKSIYYKDKKDFKTYMVYKAINNRSSFDKPNVDHLFSENFCFESWKELIK